MLKLNYTERFFFEQLERFLSVDTQDNAVSGIVREIISEVRERGDEAVIQYTAQFDQFQTDADGLRVPLSELVEAASALEPEQQKHIREAIECVRVFHERGLPKSWMGTNPHGATVGEKWYPIKRVGIYIPAGNVPLVSTIVMTVSLARLAGVREIAVFTPAGKDGRISPQMLAGLSIAGVKEVYRVGGAQAIAAMAYGTQTISKVDKVMGPGNVFVAEAQRQVFGVVGVDLLPGPSEALAFADETADPDFLAADLLAQAEHGSGKERIVFVYTDESLVELVENAIERQLKQRTHKDAIRLVLEERTAFIRVPTLAAGVEVCNQVAPEHLELHVDERRIPGLINDIYTAGAILCGHYTPTVLGDFTAGPSHTLPTSGTGHFFSGLKITDFMRRSSIVQYDKKSSQQAMPVVETFSELEDLDGHGYSLKIRFEKDEG